VKPGELGASVQLTFADGAVQRLCATQESLMRAFGELWISVKFCLTVLAAAETLADVAAFAALTVRLACQAGGDLAEFLIGHGSIWLHVRSLVPAAPVESQGSRADVLDLVRAVSVVNVTQVAAAAVGS
jgi:hypothetical protein